MSGSSVVTVDHDDYSMTRIYPFLFCILILYVLYVDVVDAFAAQSSRPNPERLLDQANTLLEERRPEKAIQKLIEVYAIDPTNTNGLQSLLERALRLKVEMEPENKGDLLGLASLYLDQEQYDKALPPLRQVLEIDPSNELAICQLFQANAACCNWSTYEQDGQRLRESLRIKEHWTRKTGTPSLHPFSALKWPHISIEDASAIASLYARRAIQSTSSSSSMEYKPTIPRETVKIHSLESQPNTKRIHIGYISPDFTSKHPLAFLMQGVFELHDREQFSITAYSCGPTDDGPEVQRIQEGVDAFVPISSTSAKEIAERIRSDNVDVLIDLCGFAGTSLIAEVMSLRPSPIQISYMGFPGSSGAPYFDYMIVDPVVVPDFLRKHYTESLIFMPHSYFVNSHSSTISETSPQRRKQVRQEYGFDEDMFVFCCHNRSNKIDPVIFETWMRALQTVKEKGKAACIWLLKSGEEMESNLRSLGETYGLDDDALVFSDIAPREEHLARLCAADLFLDTPAYNAHTVGCDALYAGVPMVSLLNSENDNSTALYSNSERFVSTEKLPSRVGASLLSAVGLDEMICPSIDAYERTMVKCAVEKDVWFSDSIRSKLHKEAQNLPLFDTARWVRNMETAIAYISDDSVSVPVDISIVD